MDMDERERIARLETRAKEAENALQQLNAYIDLLKKKAASPSTGDFCAEAQQLEEENTALKTEVAKLRQQLVTLEIRHGISQVPVPKESARSPQVSSQRPPAPPQTVASGKEAVKTSKKLKGDKKEKKTTAADVAVDVSRLDLRIGRVVKAWKHPDADTLYVEEVDLGEGRLRTVCSGLAKHVPLEEMQERVAMFLCNLKPAKMRGVSSEAMIMCASSPEKIEVLEPPPACQPGDRVYCEGYTGTPDAMLNPKKKVFETVQPDLHTNEEGVACYKSAPFRVEGKDGVFRAATMRGTGIK